MLKHAQKYKNHNSIIITNRYIEGIKEIHRIQVFLLLKMFPSTYKYFPKKDLLHLRTFKLILMQLISIGSHMFQFLYAQNIHPHHLLPYFNSSEFVVVTQSNMHFNNSQFCHIQVVSLRCNYYINTSNVNHHHHLLPHFNSSEFVVLGNDLDTS